VFFLTWKSERKIRVWNDFQQKQRARIVENIFIADVSTYLVFVKANRLT